MAIRSRNQSRSNPVALTQRDAEPRLLPLRRNSVVDASGNVERTIALSEAE
jgi:hypothetical protein